MSNLNVGGELNRQLQGINARLMQAEHNIAGMHKVTSRFREIVQGTIPAVSEVATQLNKLPSGLESTAAYVASDLTDYVQTILNQTLDKFSNPTLADILDPAGEILEGQLQDLASQIASAIQANPVVTLVDGLKGNIAHLQSLPPTPDIEAQIAALQAQVTSMTAANPIIGTVTSLRNAAQTLAGSISTYTSFLSAQKNIVAGLTRSIKIGT